MSEEFAQVVRDLMPKPTAGLKRSTEGVIDRLHRWLEKARPHEGAARSPGFHASQLYSYCPRQQVVGERLGLEKVRERHPPEKILTFMIGDAYHDLLQNTLLGDSGILRGTWRHVSAGEEVHGRKPEGKGWRFVEPRIRLRVPGCPDDMEWSIVGASDGEMEGGALIEAKSIGMGMYPHLEKEYALVPDITDWFAACGDNASWTRKYARGHTFHLTLYLYGRGKRHGYVYYLPKGQPRPPEPASKEFLVERNEAILDAAFKKVRQTYQGFNGGDWKGPLPDRVCSGPTCYKAKDCPVVTECFAWSV